MNVYSFVKVDYYIYYYLLLYLFVLIRRCYDTCTCNYQFNLSWFKSTKPSSRKEELLEVGLINRGIKKYNFCNFETEDLFELV